MPLFVNVHLSDVSFHRISASNSVPRSTTIPASVVGVPVNPLLSFTLLSSMLFLRPDWTTVWVILLLLYDELEDNEEAFSWGLIETDSDDVDESEDNEDIFDIQLYKNFDTRVEVPSYSILNKVMYSKKLNFDPQKSKSLYKTNGLEITCNKQTITWKSKSTWTAEFFYDPELREKYRE